MDYCPVSFEILSIFAMPYFHIGVDACALTSNKFNNPQAKTKTLIEKQSEKIIRLYPDGA